jgi:hypothetical protein
VDAKEIATRRYGGNHPAQKLMKAQILFRADAGAGDA